MGDGLVAPTDGQSVANLVCQNSLISLENSTANVNKIVEKDKKGAQSDAAPIAEPTAPKIAEKAAVSEHEKSEVTAKPEDQLQQK